ncbi:IS1 transposase [Alysiella crassa]|uniref:IS1 transposase n=2 Tax=Alysiella crassa TaxID=153491 RepID=A0A376BUN3_9NEIS|nr:IS1 transposase [Alysiella crassa]
MIWRMIVNGCSIRAISRIMAYSRAKIQAALKRSEHQITPKQKHYDTLQIDEFHTFVGHKKNKVWLIYAYHAKTGEIVAFVWGKRDLQTALALKTRLKELKVTYDRIASDEWDAFVNAFSDADDQWIGKQHTKAIEGNNCRIRHRLSRAIRRSRCFSKTLFYHIKAFNIGFWAMNNPKQV